MSDSFADLWNSTAPSKPTSAPQKLGSLASNTSTSNINTNAQRRAQYDTFSMLSSAGTSTQSSRSGTPGGVGSAGGRASQASQGSLGIQPLRPTSAASTSSSKAVLGGGDAFKDLLGSTIKSSNEMANMTIAERAKLVERQRLGQQQQQPKVVIDGAWQGLDSLVLPGGGIKSKLGVEVEERKEDDWDFALGSLSTAAPAKPTATTSTLDDDDWGLSSEFVKAPIAAPSQPPPKPKVTRPQPQSKSLWDLDEFSPGVSPIPNSSKALNLDDDFGFGNASPHNLRARTDSPSGDFDFGSREDELLEDTEHDGDILGVLSKPVSERRSPESLPPQLQQPQQQSRSRAASPPPHILGQLVEMGFSIQQAKVALAATDTGDDVQAALEILISSGAADSERDMNRQEWPRESEAGEPLRPGSQHPRRRPHEQERDGDYSERRQDQDTPELNFQEQADKLREIGMNMFSKASLFWKEGKERVQKAVEERVGPVAEAGKGKGTTPGRPRWMQEALEEDEVVREVGGAFRDDDDVQAEALRRTVQQEQQRREPQKQVQQPAPSAISKIADLFSASEEPVVYKSRFRHRTTQASASPSFTPPAAAVTPPRPPTPLKQRAVISCSPSSLSQSEAHKSTGTEKFKLGQYAAAEESYTSAIACLPSNHLMLVPLYNNRALVRMKNGNYVGAAEDACVVIEIIGEQYHPARETKIEGRKEDGAGIDLSDGFTKALKRRAEAWEGRERWSDAGKDWERLAGMEWVKQSVKTEAVRGAGRCRRMVEAAAKPATAPSKPKPKPVLRPKPQSQGPSKAVSALRETTSAAEAEDTAKHQLKDSVDTRLLAWKGGKETNLRALLSSLDTILWPELGLQKISLAELMSAGQVKKWYMKAIAKVHPDKLNAGNSTVEQRMLAGGVFAALNEAWNAFKP